MNDARIDEHRAHERLGAAQRFGLPQWAAMAATLVIGVLLGRAALPERGSLAVEEGVLVAQGRLAQALSTRLATDPGVIRVGLSLLDSDGRYCRSFQSEMDRLAGLACRDDGRWAVVVTSVLTPSRDPAYRTAGSETSPVVLAAVEELIVGEPLDAEAEQAARDRNWTAPPPAAGR